MISRQKYVLRLNVPVKNLPSMNIVQRDTNLNKPIQNFFFSEAFPFLRFLLDVGSKIADFTVFHLNVKRILLYKTVHISHDVGVL